MAIPPCTFGEAFRGKRDQLIQKIDISHGLLVSLQDMDVISKAHKQDIEGQTTERDKIYKLLDILERRPDYLYRDFCDALDKNFQSHVTDILRGRPSPVGAADGSVRQANSTAGVAADAAAAATGIPTSEYMRIRRSGVIHKVSQDHLPQEINKIPYNQLTELKEIAQGGFGVVYLAKHRDWGTVAYKELKAAVIKETDKVAKDLLREAKMHVLRHPNIVAMYGLTFEPKHYGVVFEYIEFGGLDEFIKAYDVEWMMKLSIAHGTIRGLNYLHTKEPPIIHGDLKAQNVLIGEGYVPKICDFGLSKWQKYSTARTGRQTQRGTVTHIPPENWENINRSRTVKFDVYGFGILLWELLAEDTPFSETANPALIHAAVIAGQRPDLESIKKEDGDGQVTYEVYQFGRTCIEDCWHQESDKRPTFGDLDSRFEAFLKAHEAQVQKSIDNLNNEILKSVDITDVPSGQTV